ncbi:helix-turn-helix domain-containing protein [Streptomyces sp. SID8361]|uniref:helix-turn-helix domain-containing protein n=1 Tax=Streptomyces sp. MnatMP-M27 TaxID=1839768 RepID=UPI00081D4196|nr:helix-turn-helix transcriptional regulator [Streptomyces sp. MnatMP-M27]MYU12921.1 helix-turn-helix domain-containing protein [Streptomyces sp. SID8361]SCF96222.1 Helix-turn-helix domain-containing protein [Streptomyces sp. MnatMP-M27]
MSNDRRMWFGTYLARLRRATGRSQRQLAERLCALSGLDSVTRHEISRWERGTRVPDAWLATLAQALGVPTGGLEAAAAYARGETDTAPGGPSASLAELLPPGDPLAPLRGRSGRRVGAETVGRLAARVHGLRLADDVLAGGDLIGPAFRELGAAIRLYRETSHTEDVGSALLAQIGELAQIAGWIASDAGRHEQAERTYTIGISAARQAGDEPLVAHLAGSLGYQLSNTGREREGLGLALAAVEEAGADAPAKARALFLDRVAWAHTRAGEAPPAVRALGAAHDALSADDGAEAPQWAYWVSRAELEVMDARVFTELARPLRAVPLLTDVLARYDATHAREVALYRSWLAVALADANEPEQAAAEARLVLTASADVASERATERSRVVLRRLRGFEDVPEVRDLLNEHGRLLAG